MGIEALTRDASGADVAPRSPDDWQDWISATATRNHALNDPLLDWLDLFGRARGFVPDEELPGYDPRTDFTRFITRKGREFEEAVTAHLRTLTSVHDSGVRGLAESRDLGAATETFAAMRRGAPVVSQAVLWDAEARTYGVADLLVRSDTLLRLFPDTLTADAAAVPAPDLGGGPWHYRVVDIKFTTLHFRASGRLGETGGSTWAYMVQLSIYNRALGRLQGYLPPEAFLLGRGWQQGTKRGAGCLERLGGVPPDYHSKSRGSLASATDAATAWVRRLRTEGANWRLSPEPSCPDLRPNMTSGSDGGWHAAKQSIAATLDDLTLLWQVGLSGRERALAAGVTRWTDPACTPELVGVRGDRLGPTLSAVLDVNRNTTVEPVQPDRVRAEEAVWRPVPSLEFYVDFETVSDLDDDFSRMPRRGGQTLIFMVGCGHVEGGAWTWSCFTVEALTEAAEVEVIDAWFAHMAAVTERLDPDGAPPLVFHWSHAESSSFETAFNSAKRHHPDAAWASPRWFDLLGRVVRAEPVVVRGALGFGLKAVAKAMHAHGLVQTDWDAGPTDGLGAMVGAWWCAHEAETIGVALRDVPLMGEIAGYNEVDCRAMMEVLRYLRERR